MTKQKIKRNWDRKDWWISADECLELELVDEIRAMMVELDAACEDGDEASCEELEEMMASLEEEKEEQKEECDREKEESEDEETSDEE